MEIEFGYKVRNPRKVSLLYEDCIRNNPALVEALTMCKIGIAYQLHMEANTLHCRLGPEIHVKNPIANLHLVNTPYDEAHMERTILMRGSVVGADGLVDLQCKCRLFLVMQDLVVVSSSERLKPIYPEASVVENIV